MPEGPAYKAIAARKVAERDALIPPEWRLKELPPPSQLSVLDVPRTCGILTPDELRITELPDATSLLSEVHSGRLKALDVARAFCKRAAVAQQLTNCLTEIFFAPALARAAELDAHFARHGTPLGPLHGLPVSLKDTFRVRGVDASIGLAALCGRPSAANATLVDTLLAAGAVLYCKTNVPQTMMALDSHNYVFGRTVNPANRLLTAGGSSGGEGALVAMRGSLLGVGTDVGGSVRIPAMCHGLVGVKPSHGRVSYAGLEGGARAGSESVGVRASAGPIAWSVRDCELFMRVVGEGRGWEVDPEVVPMEWRGGRALGKREDVLRVGVVRTDGVTTPLPPIQGFLEEVVQKLNRSGRVEIVELEVEGLMKQCASLVNKMFSIDGANQMFDLIEATGEPLSPWLQSRLTRRPQASVDRVIDLQGQRNALQTRFAKVWTGQGGFWKGAKRDDGKTLDVLIAPVAPHPLPEIDRWNTAAYTSSFVLLDYPAATLPVRKMGERDLKGEIKDKTPISNWDKYNMTLWDNVDRQVYLDTPLCLQIIGQRLQDEKVLEAMTVLDDVLGGPSGSTRGIRAQL
ncbi:hypothetical protein CAC42_6960 [Sphaceloma murrayae]|uniref:amidase n=1 Tax=Sphaceloma murrayae TaxID=2082308 RepID=A0A2K1QQA4_9PEZI|nr:hypothetical protein CAC42_6960 [Sphaceloma murrayae]